MSVLFSSTRRRATARRRPGRVTRKATVAMALTAATATAAFLPATGAAAAAPVTITWYTQPVNTTPVVADLVKAFEAAYPSIKVKDVVGPSDVDTVRATLATEIASGSSTPDVYEGDVTWPAQFAKNNLALELGKYLPASFFNSFAPGLLSEAKYNGTYVMAPWFMEAGFLYYRKDLLAAAHLPVPKTWEQLESEAKTLVAAHKARYGFVWQGDTYEGLTCDFVEDLADAGGSVTNATYTSSTVDSPAAAEAVNFMRSTITSGITPQSVTTFEEPQSLSAFDAGDAVFMRNWAYAWAIIQTPSSSSVVGKVGMVPLPTFAGHSYPGASVVGGGNLYINPHSAHLAQDLTFIKWLSGTTAQTMLATIGNVLPTNYSVQKSPKVRSLDMPLSVLPELHLISRPVATADYAAVSEALYRNINSALSGNVSVSSALASASQQVNAALSGAGSL